VRSFNRSAAAFHFTLECPRPLALSLRVTSPPSLYRAGDTQLVPHITLFASFGAINIFLCVLQQYWGYKVVSAAMKMAKGEKAGREKEY
jgi:hypothetical protein